MDELDFYNPYDDELDDLTLVEVEKPKKRRKRKNPESAIVAMPVLLAVIAYLGWCAYASKSGIWSWQPWKKLAGRPRLQLRQANNAQVEEERRRAELHRHIEEAMKPTVFTVDTEVPWRPVYADTEKERVSFITP